MDNLNDKDLMRQGRWFEALGDNYTAKEYYLLDFINGRNNEPITMKKEFYSKFEAHNYGKENCVDYMICSHNADWR